MNINITRESEVTTMLTIKHTGIVVWVTMDPETGMWSVEAFKSPAQYIGDSINRTDAEAMALDWAYRVATPANG